MRTCKTGRVTAAFDGCERCVNGVALPFCDLT
jgi:hypothetical protein